MLMMPASCHYWTQVAVDRSSSSALWMTTTTCSRLTRWAVGGIAASSPATNPISIKATMAVETIARGACALPRLMSTSRSKGVRKSTLTAEAPAPSTSTSSCAEWSSPRWIRMVLLRRASNNSCAKWSHCSLPQISSSNRKLLRTARIIWCTQGAQSTWTLRLTRRKKNMISTWCSSNKV